MLADSLRTDRHGFRAVRVSDPWIIRLRELTRLDEELELLLSAPLLPGRALSIGMILYGLLATQFMLVFFGIFIYLGAAQEASAAVGRTLTHGVPVCAAMIADFRTLITAI